MASSMGINRPEYSMYDTYRRVHAGSLRPGWQTPERRAIQRLAHLEIWGLLDAG